MRNRGEWSKLYALVKLLVDGEVKTSDPRTVDRPVLRAERADECRSITYDISARDGGLRILDNGYPVDYIELERLQQVLPPMLDDISRGIGRFDVAAAQNVIRALRYDAIRVLQSSPDLLVTLGPVPREIGVNTSSRLGGAHTLLNASQHTRFIYSVTDKTGLPVPPNFGADQSLRSRLATIVSNGGAIEFSHLPSVPFAGNLERIHVQLPQVLGAFVKRFYLGGGNRLFETAGIRASLSDEEMRLSLSRLLREISFGMVPASPWTPFDENQDTGELIVTENGEVSIRLTGSSDPDFGLLKGVKLEMPSTRKHNFGFLYQHGERTFVDLILQIRYIR